MNKKSNVKNKKTLIIILVALLLILIAGTAYILIYNPFSTTEDSPTTEDEPDYTNQLLDVSEYTDIELTNYDGLAVSVFQGFEESPSVKAKDGYLPGIVRYSLKDWTENLESDQVKYVQYGPDMRMSIVNSDNITNPVQQSKFDEAKQDILNHNTEANSLEFGYLDIFKDFIGGEARHDFVKEIEGVKYPNTEETFAVLFIGGYQDGPFAYPDSEENIGGPFVIKVYSIKDNNLITLSSRHLNTAELGVSRDEHMECVIEGEEPEYDTDCLVDILKDEKYDEKVLEFTNDLFDRFELTN
jgi:hypothetical protein